MPLELYLGYVVATVVVLAVPGPTIVLVVSYALTQGRRSALATVAGVGLGDATSVTVSLLGLGAVMAASATLFTGLKWVGALYLLWLGVRMWRSDAKPLEALATREAKAGAMFAHTWIVTSLNPKAIAFYVAFMPHFVVPDAPIAPQLVLLGTTFVVLGVVNASIYAVFASAVGRRVQTASTLKLMNRIGGSFLIGAGLMTAAIRRAS